MKLTEIEKEEAKNWIISVPKYRETYNELYDHILNSLKDMDGTFSTDIVDEIVLKDFGGYQAVVTEEKLYQISSGKQYNKIFRNEFINTFKWPRNIGNVIILVLCIILYYNFETTYFTIKAILLSALICFVSVAIFGFSKIILNKRKYFKYSILDNYLAYTSTFGLIMTNWLMGSFISKHSFLDINSDTKLIITLFLFFFSSVYVRAFINFYNQKLTVLST